MSLNFYLRFGTHSEAEPYVLRRGVHDGVILNANMIEATPGGTATLAMKMAMTLCAPCLIDPYTHVFALDPSLLTSVRKTTGEVQLKSTFRSVADRYGEPFKSKAGREALEPSDFGSDEVVRGATERVVEYQRTRIDERLKEDEKTRRWLTGFRSLTPPVLLAPYFLNDGSDEWLGANVRLAEAAAFGGRSVSAVVCMDRGILANIDALGRLIAAYQGLAVGGYFLWVSDLREEEATARELAGLRTLVESLSVGNRQVCNLHAGYFSMALSLKGLTAYSHGVGYGEHRNVVPATGGGLPPERFYYPPLHSRLVPPRARDVIEGLGIDTVAAYRARVCECQLCQVVIKDSVGEEFRYFEELGPPRIGKDGRARRYPTAEAIQRCRYHYLLNRLRERRELATMTVDEVARSFRGVAENMECARLHDTFYGHLRRWAAALEAADS